MQLPAPPRGALRRTRVQVCALLDQLGAAVGLAATPESQWVYVLAFVLVR